MRLTDFGLCVRTLRMKYEITLREMAKALSISSPYLSSIEFGERKLTQKIIEQTMNFLRPKISKAELEGLDEACHKTLDEVPVSNLNGDNRNLVAMFARRLSEGHEVTPEIKHWIERKGLDDSNK